MSGWPAAALAAGLAAALTLVFFVLTRAPWVPRTANYRGARLRVNLGIAGVAGASPVVAMVAVDRRLLPWLGAAVAILFVAGLYDDYQPGKVGGLVAHFRALRGGTVTSGIVKLVAAVVAATLIAVGGSSPAGSLLMIPVVAGCSNLWNLLDVAPGRSLKFFLVAAAFLVAIRPGLASLLAPAIGAAFALLPLDLQERGMLGDTGSNILGFVIGVSLFFTLPDQSMMAPLVALLVVVLLHAVSETVTLSRVIATVGPLRWFDDLGQRPERKARNAGVPAVARNVDDR